MHDVIWRTRNTWLHEDRCGSMGKQVESVSRRALLLEGIPLKVHPMDVHLRAKPKGVPHYFVPSTHLQTLQVTVHAPVYGWNPEHTPSMTTVSKLWDTVPKILAKFCDYHASYCFPWSLHPQDRLHLGKTGQYCPPNNSSHFHPWQKTGGRISCRCLPGKQTCTNLV